MPRKVGARRPPKKQAENQKSNPGHEESTVENPTSSNPGHGNPGDGNESSRGKDERRPRSGKGI